MSFKHVAIVTGIILFQITASKSIPLGNKILSRRSRDKSFEVATELQNSSQPQQKMKDNLDANGKQHVKRELLKQIIGRFLQPPQTFHLKNKENNSEIEDLQGEIFQKIKGRIDELMQAAEMEKNEKLDHNNKSNHETDNIIMGRTFNCYYPSYKKPIATATSKFIDNCYDWVSHKDCKDNPRTSPHLPSPTTTTSKYIKDCFGSHLSHKHCIHDPRYSFSTKAKTTTKTTTKTTAKSTTASTTTTTTPNAKTTTKTTTKTTAKSTTASTTTSTTPTKPIATTTSKYIDGCFGWHLSHDHCKDDPRYSPITEETAGKSTTASTTATTTPTAKTTTKTTAKSTTASTTTTTTTTEPIATTSSKYIDGCYGWHLSHDHCKDDPRYSPITEETTGKSTTASTTTTTTPTAKTATKTTEKSTTASTTTTTTPTAKTATKTTAKSTTASTTTTTTTTAKTTTKTTAKSTTASPTTTTTPTDVTTTQGEEETSEGMRMCIKMGGKIHIIKL